MSEWLPIETAPKDGTTIDVWLSGRINSNIGFRETDVWWGTVSGQEGQAGWVLIEDDGTEGYVDLLHDSYIVTHWMPLPKPPLT